MPPTLFVFEIGSLPGSWPLTSRQNIVANVNNEIGKTQELSKAAIINQLFDAFPSDESRGKPIAPGLLWEAGTELQTTLYAAVVAEAERISFTPNLPDDLGVVILANVGPLEFWNATYTDVGLAAGPSRIQIPVATVYDRSTGKALTGYVVG